MNVKNIREITKNLNLLYVEDEKEIREESVKFFGRFFKSVDSAQNGEEGLKLFSKNTYDIVISDLKMPIMGGEEMLNKIKKINPNTYLVAISGISGRDETIELDADYYLNKPTEHEALIKMLENIICAKKQDKGLKNV